MTVAQTQAEERLQSLQPMVDFFCRTTGMAADVKMFDEDARRLRSVVGAGIGGPLPCRAVLTDPELGERCARCDLNHLQLAHQLERYVIYECHAGMVDIVAPILGLPIKAGVFTGQVLPRPLSREERERLIQQLSTPVSGREFIFEWLPPQGEPWTDAWSSDHWGIRDGSRWVCFNTCNLIRKYGAAYWRARSTERAIRRIRCWGFSGGGKWGGPPTLTSTPVLSAGSTPKLVKHPDVFDPAVRATFRAELEGQIGSARSDPRVLGWSVDNEYNEIITRGEITGILAKPAGTPAKRALLDYAVDRLYGGSVADLARAWRISAGDRASLYGLSPVPPAANLEKLRCFYADRYYAFIYQTVRSIDPNHLYLGFWIMPEWWQSEEDWRLIARHCDVIGYDRYAQEYASPLLARLQAETNKPTLCGEFSFPPYYEGQRGFARFQVSSRNDADAGDMYHRWVEAAAKDPYCVGQIIFEYRDQPLTGRGPGHGVRLTFGEHFAFGLVTETDRPKWDMVRRVHAANLNAAKWRLEASTRQPR